MEKLAENQFSFKKECRLHSREDFLYLRSNSRRLSTPLLMFYFKNSRISSQNTRIAFSISRKIGKAIIRNRLKRIFREIFRQSTFKHLKLDGLFVVNPKMVRQFPSSEGMEVELKRDFVKLLNQAAYQQRK